MAFFIFNKEAGRNQKLMAEVKSVGDLSKALTIQLFALLPAFTLINLISWFFFIRKYSEGSILDSIEWYIICPFLCQTLALILLFSLEKIAKKRNRWEKLESSIPYRIIAMFSYTIFFACEAYAYKETESACLYLAIPLIIVCFYRQVKWMVTEIIIQCIFLTLYIFLPALNPAPIKDIPSMLRLISTFTVCALTIVYAYNLHTYIEVLISNIVEINANEKARSQFFAKVSHEIRTPVNAILGMDEMILRESSDEEILGYAENIKTAGKAILATVNEVLDSAKLEAGKLEICDSNYELTSVLSDSYNLVVLRAHDKGLDFKVVNDPTIPKSLYGDDVRIRQVITNLLTNAIKYTKEGYVEFGIFWKKLEGDMMELIISVKDTGIGISKDNIPTLFDSFDRTNVKEINHIEGTGLGLSITKQLVEMMGGKIEVESKVGEGSTFAVTIPQKIIGDTPIGDFYKNIKIRTGSKEKYKERFQAPNAEILVVDDVPMNIDVFRGLLKKTLVKIDSANSGQKALELIEKKKYDIIFLDHVMPDMDGLETLKRLQIMDHRNQGTPIIALTANVSVNAHAEYAEAGFTDYLAKPIRGTQLEEMILKYLQKNRVESRNASTVEVGTDKFLKRLPFLDTVVGLSCCANDEGLYRQIVDDYREENRSEALNEAFKKNDWEKYRIAIHALKSTSLSIGALELSEEAKRLENAVSDRNFDFVEENHDSCIRHYEQLLAKPDMVF